MQISKVNYRKVLSSIAIGLLICQVFGVWIQHDWLNLASGQPVLSFKWAVHLSSAAYGGTVIGDINGDGVGEVLHAGSGRATCLNGVDGSIIWDRSVSGGSGQPQMADLDGDGVLDLIVTIASSGVEVLFGQNGSTYWRTTGLGGSSFNSPIACDINADGLPEVFYSSQDITQGWNGTGRVTSLTHDGKIISQVFAWRPCAGGLSVADADFDGNFELYMGDRHRYYPDGGCGRGVRAFDISPDGVLTSKWNHSDILMSSHIPMIADVNKDGVLDVIVCHQLGGLAVLNANDGSAIRKQLYLITNDGEPFPGHYQPSVADIDYDGNLEILAADGDHPDRSTQDVVIWDLVEWKEDGRMPHVCKMGPQTADVTGDGKLDVIVASYTGIHIYTWNETIDDFSFVTQVTGLSGTLGSAVVQDIDGDGLNELVIGSSSGWVYAYDTPAPAPTPRARSHIQFYGEHRCGAALYQAIPGPHQPILSEEQPSNDSIAVSINPTLSIRAFDYQEDKMNITFSTNASGTWQNIGSYINVENGVYSQATTNMDDYDTVYYWAVNATESGGGISTYQMYEFTTYRPAPWWNIGWPYRKEITIDHTKVRASTLTNFPVLIDITDSDLASKAQDDGDDIVFTDYLSVQLNHEIELYDSSTGHLVAWVNVPSLSSTTDTFLYMYYGNAAANQENVEAVWDSHYMMVQHLNEVSGAHYDSTVNDNDGSASGVVQDATGQIDGADDFDGTDDYVQIPHNNTLTGFTEAMTATAWIKLDDVVTWQTILCKYDTTGAQRGWEFDYRVDPQNAFGFTASPIGETGQFEAWTAPYAPSSGNWYYVAVVWQSNQITKFYVNGEQVDVEGTGTIPHIYNNTEEPLYIGRAYSGASGGERNLDGIIDEDRVSNIARSSSWIFTCYSNQYDPSGFYSVGSEEAPNLSTTIGIDPVTTAAVLDADYTVYIEVANVTDLYGWEFQLDYDPSILNLTSASIVPGGLNTPTQTFYNLIDEVGGHLWWAVSTKHPTLMGISYVEHAIFEMHFHTIAIGTSNLNLYSTFLSYSDGDPISHTVVNGSITVSEVGEIDLTVTDINILSHGCSLYANDAYVNGTVYYYPVEVTVHNGGMQAAGSFYVELEVYWINGSLSEASAEILVSSLAAETSVVVNFTSLFHPMHTGHYRLTATADSQDDVIETNETNNALVQSGIPVAVMGDVNGDGEVNILDGVIISLAWAATPSDPRWNIKADVNHDGVIDILDGVRVAIHWSKTW